MKEVPRVWQGSQVMLWEEGVSDPVALSALSWGAGPCPGFQWVKNLRRGDETQGQAVSQEPCCQKRQRTGMSWQQGCEVLHPRGLTRIQERGCRKPIVNHHSTGTDGVAPAEHKRFVDQVPQNGGDPEALLPLRPGSGHKSKPKSRH